MSIFNAPFVAAYGAIPGRATSLCNETMLTILPVPRGTIRRATARPTRKALVTFVSMSRYQSWSVNVDERARCWVPTLLTRMSSGPTRSSMAATADSTASGSVTSNATAWTAVPVQAAISARAASRRSSSWPLSTTVHPASTRPCARPRPIPRLDPVTRAVRPDRSKAGCIMP